MHGDLFVLGDDLVLYSSLLWYDTVFFEGMVVECEYVFVVRFWSDGMLRLMVYEY